MAKLKLYTVQTMNKVTANSFSLLDSDDFKELSSRMVRRLTLFNVSLILKEWKDTENGSWVDPQLIETGSDPWKRNH